LVVLVFRAQLKNLFEISEIPKKKKLMLTEKK